MKIKFLIIITLLFLLLSNLYFHNNNIKNILTISLIVLFSMENMYVGLLMTIFFLYTHNYYIDNYEEFSNKNKNNTNKNTNKNNKNSKKEDKKTDDFQKEFDYMTDILNKTKKDNGDVSDNTLDYNLLSQFQNLDEVEKQKILNSNVFKNIITELKTKTDSYFDLLDNSIVDLEKKVKKNLK